MKKISINKIDFYLNAHFDKFFSSKVQNLSELIDLLENSLFPSFMEKTMPIVQNINTLIKTNDYCFDAYLYLSDELSCINLLLSTYIDGRKIHIGYFLFNNYTNKNTDINIDINLEIIADNGVELIPPLKDMPDNQIYNLSNMKEHFIKLFSSLTIDDYYLEFYKSPLISVTFDDKTINKKISSIFNYEKEMSYFNLLREEYRIIKNDFKDTIDVRNIIDDKGIYKMIDFTYHKASQYVNGHLLTKIFNNLGDSMEDSFIRGFIYIEFFSPIVIETYLNNENMTLKDMLDMQSMTEY